MSIAPLKWTYETKVSPAPEWADEDYTTFHTIFLKDCEWNATKLRRILGGIKSTQFTLSDVSEEFVKRMRDYDKLHEWATNLRCDVKLLIEDIEAGKVFDLEDCLERLKEMSA